MEFLPEDLSDVSPAILPHVCELVDDLSVLLANRQQRVEELEALLRRIDSGEFGCWTHTLGMVIGEVLDASRVSGDAAS